MRDDWTGVGASADRCGCRHRVPPGVAHDILPDMSTRKLILLALLCGMAILVAGAVQLVMIMS